MDLERVEINILTNDLAKKISKRVSKRTKYLQQRFLVAFWERVGSEKETILRNVAWSFEALFLEA